MKHISLFSGIGGFDLAAKWAGWDNLASCEINPFGRRVLSHYWPHAYHHDDIKTLTGEKIEHEAQKRYGPDWRADGVILSGGFPCQPYSLAGKRLGKEDERHLWPEMCRIIREIKPDWIVGENVLGLVNWSNGLVFDEVQTDLETAGYEVQAYVLPACAADAPHRRDRVWIVAKSIENTMRSGCLRGQPEQEGTKDGQQRNIGTGDTNWFCGKEVARFDTCTNRKSNWRNFPAEPPVYIGSNGFSAKLDGITFSKWRNESIKAAGNAIVPQIAFRIFETINIFTQHNTHGTQFEQTNPQTNARARARE